MKGRKRLLFKQVVLVGLTFSLLEGCCPPKPYQPSYIAEKTMENKKQVVLEENQPDDNAQEGSY